MVTVASFFPSVLGLSAVEARVGLGGFTGGVGGGEEARRFGTGAGARAEEVMAMEGAEEGGVETKRPVEGCRRAGRCEVTKFARSASKARA